MIGKLLKWGNSYGIRLSKDDVERLGIRPGGEVIVEVRATEHTKIDLSHLVFVRDDPDLSTKHDELGWA